ARARRTRPVHCDREDRHRDRAGGRHVLREGRPGPEGRGPRRAGARTRGARAGARPADLTMLGRYREPIRSWTDPIGLALYRQFHLRPNHLKLIGLGMSVLDATVFCTARYRLCGMT